MLGKGANEEGGETQTKQGRRNEKRRRRGDRSKEDGGRRELKVGVCLRGYQSKLINVCCVEGRFRREGRRDGKAQGGRRNDNTRVVRFVYREAWMKERGRAITQCGGTHKDEQSIRNGH